MKTQEFRDLMQTVADGWNEGNARKAAECFAEDAIYIEPPNKQLFEGRDQLFVYFGGDSGRAKQMKMNWHNIVFDEDTQIGMGEYTFEMGDKNHGVVVTEINNGKISVWREYQWSGNLNYDEFAASQGKTFEFTIKDLK